MRSRCWPQFAVTARDETDLDALTAELARVVQETLQPEDVSVWLKEMRGADGQQSRISFGTRETSPVVTFAVTISGRSSGTLTASQGRRSNYAQSISQTNSKGVGPAQPSQGAGQAGRGDGSDPAVGFRAERPIGRYLLSAGGPVDLERLTLDSPALRSLREAGVKLIAPLAGQGELIGLLNLGPRRSEQEYTTDDRKLLGDLATQAAPAVRVAQLVRQQQIEAQARERLEQELRVARVVQQTLLPKELPELAGWKVAAYWQPAQAVSGDFYDFINLRDGNLGIVEADVTGKGVPAALVMASAAASPRCGRTGSHVARQVLAHVNELLCPDIPPSMFVTCLYGVLNPHTGRFIFANAGHNLPAKCTVEAVVELRADRHAAGTAARYDLRRV